MSLIESCAPLKTGVAGSGKEKPGTVVPEFCKIQRRFPSLAPSNCHALSSHSMATKRQNRREHELAPTITS
ncbi:hypothetical protein NDU88_004506 [Pleurodeles waltl]|uniref:Uncharacterized protein n=1 Tax=Pleurodeles waltl TaxID=8319 RepID=A0AAV7W6U8_PLEWA|nr:hypothetical protein NDU88_004506 [Pleurodeles waltl]